MIRWIGRGFISDLYWLFVQLANGWSKRMIQKSVITLSHSPCILIYLIWVERSLVKLSGKYKVSNWTAANFGTLRMIRGRQEAFRSGLLRLILYHLRHIDKIPLLRMLHPFHVLKVDSFSIHEAMRGSQLCFHPCSWLIFTPSFVLEWFHVSHPWWWLRIS